MWNSDNPLKVYLAMSKDFSDEELKKLQEVIDEDKELDSRRNNRDVCGEYAPFCEFCDKNLNYSCAHAYIKMKSAEGFDTVEAEPEHSVEEPVTEVSQIEVTEEISNVIADEIIEVTPTPVDEKPKKLIRIAHIKRVK